MIGNQIYLLRKSNGVSRKRKVYFT